MDYSFSDGNIFISEIHPFLSTSQLGISLELPVTSSQLPVPDNTRIMNLPRGQINYKKFLDIQLKTQNAYRTFNLSTMTIPESLQPSSFTQKPSPGMVYLLGRSKIVVGVYSQCVQCQVHEHGQQASSVGGNRAVSKFGASAQPTN